MLLDDAAHLNVHLLGQQLVAMPLRVVVGGRAEVPLREHDPRLRWDDGGVGGDPSSALGREVQRLGTRPEQPVRAAASLEGLGVSSSTVNLIKAREGAGDEGVGKSSCREGEGVGGDGEGVVG